MQTKNRTIGADAAAQDRKVWLVEVEEKQAHIYEKTKVGTQWLGDVRMEHDHISLEIPDMNTRTKLPVAPSSHTLPFTISFVKWLCSAEKRRIFDKAILMAEAGRVIDLQEALEKHRLSCIKLTTTEVLAKNESEDSLAQCMWH